MKLTAFLLAFGTEVPIPTREIEIPEEDGDGLLTKCNDRAAWVAGKLELAFMYGQNDFQPRPIRSVSVGDVIKLGDGSLHRVLGCGWEPLPAGTDVTTLERGASASFR
jgi:hypothetical protein